MFSVEVNNLSVAYGHNIVVDNVSFSFQQGEILAIIGPNGSGKTTLLKSLLGIQAIKCGSILINGYKPQQAIRLFKGEIAYLPQQHHVNLLLPLTVYDVVAQGFFARIPWGKKLSILEKEKINNVLEKVQLLNQKNELFMNLSGGQKQRVLLALALSSEPKLLFLDEPTNALDVTAIDQIYKILVELKKENMGIMIISHDISTIVSHADRVGILMKEIKYLGSPNKISESIIHQTFGSHIKIIPNDPNCQECESYRAL